MWQSFTSFFVSQVIRIGSLGFKVWQVVLVILVIFASASGVYVYFRMSSNQTSNISQHVLVFIGGLNTSMDNCEEGTFDPLINDYLTKQISVKNPYANYCNDNKDNNYFNQSTSIAYYSYNGGHMDAQTGVWIPNKYDACTSVNLYTFEQDVQTFDEMLTSYHQFYPNAHFTIVAHSLGGVVALQGAYDYAVNKHNTDIDKVITIDSPLAGVLPAAAVSGETTNYFDLWKSIVETEACPIGGHNGLVVVDDLTSLGEVTALAGTPTCHLPLNQTEAKLSSCKAKALAASGVGVMTLGNDKDTLFCNGSTQDSAGLVNTCGGQMLASTYSTFNKLYDIVPTDGFIDPRNGLGAGHGMILKTSYSEQDIVRDILAPVVTITQPQPEQTDWFHSTGTPVSYSATIHCLWGSANHAQAQITLADGSNFFAGMANATDSHTIRDSQTLLLNGVVNLPASVDRGTAWFQVQAGGDSCTYPGINSIAIPHDENVFSGSPFGGPHFFLDGGKIAAGISGQLYAGKPTGGTIVNKPLDYTRYNQDVSDNSILDVAWSHDGTRVAYLVRTSVSYGDTTASKEDLYIASSFLTGSQKLTANLLNAVALTWDTSDDKIAILEETEGHNGQGPGGFFFTPSIVIVDASTGVGRQHINLPVSASTFVAECGENCYDPRARIQWGTNGMFLLGYGNVGSTLVTATGQATEIEASQNIFLDGASVGAMNTQGTFVVYPANAGNNQMNINFYQVNPSSASLGNPTTLTSLIGQNSSGSSTLDISPDGTKVGICANQEVLVADIEHPGKVQTLTTLPVGSGGSSISCGNLRWSPDGQSIVVQITGYDVSVSGLAILPLNGANPQILFGCDLSSTTTIQYDPNGGTNCYGGPVFDLQPLVDNQSFPSVPLSSPPTSNAKLLAQGLVLPASAGQTVSAGQTFSVYFDFENTGNTTWTSASGYTLACDQYYMPNSNCMSGVPQSLNDAPVQPGMQATFYLALTASTKPGTYQTAWDMHNKGSIFGQNHVFVTVTVTAPVNSLTTVDWANFTYTSSNCYSNGPQQFTTTNNTATNNGVTFTVEKPIFGDLTGDGQPEAVILYSCVAADSIGPRVLVYSGNAAHPVLLADLPSQNDTLGRVTSAKIIHGTLQLSGAGYAPSDPTCCPSLHVTTTYSWDGTQFQIVNSTST